jgi:cathepsin F/cysteine peptidase B
MKTALLCVALVLIVGASARTLADDQRLFSDFVSVYNRQYDASQRAHHFACFRRNLVEIDRRNADPKEQAHFGVNQFADLCADEFAVMLGARLPKSVSPNNTHVKSDLPKAPAAGMIDWRSKGAVTPVKNQGMCGSCWSFSATGNMEGQWFLAGNTLVGLSEEELVQCDHNDCFGCQGGWMDMAFDWVTSNNGIDSEMDYPYTSGGGDTGMCNTQKLQNVVAKVNGHQDLPSDEGQMASWVAVNGPLSIALDAMSWQTYSGGIMSNCMGSQLDHGVLIIGYDTTFSTPYWIVKNSWGSMWGENGYIRLAYGSNQCNLTAKPSSSKRM